MKIHEFNLEKAKQYEREMVGLQNIFRNRLITLPFNIANDDSLKFQMHAANYPYQACTTEGGLLKPAICDIFACKCC